MATAKIPVYIDDHYAFLDGNLRCLFGEYETEQEAISAMKDFVDDFLHEHRKRGMSAVILYQGYCQYFDNPYCLESTFSAAEYAKQRCKELCN